MSMLLRSNEPSAPGKKVEWGCSRILVRDCATDGWINYMLKGRQKSAFDGFFVCVIVESFYNPIVDA